MGEGLVAVPALVSTCCPDTQIRLGLTFWKAMSSGLSIPWEPTSKISCTSGQRTVQAGAARRFDSLWCLPRRSRARPPLFPHSTGGEGLGCPRWSWGSPGLGGSVGTGAGPAPWQQLWGLLGCGTRDVPNTRIWGDGGRALPADGAPRSAAGRRERSGVR